MHHDEYRAGFEHRTRNNRPRRYVAHPDPTGPRLVEITNGNQATVRPAPPRPLTDREIEELADKILAQLRCRHPRIINLRCDTCGDHIASEDLQ